MATKYYDIESSMDKYGDSPSARKYLQGVIDRSDPDSFHWSHIDRARELMQRDITRGQMEGEARCYWTDRGGHTHVVKNLDWVIRHRHEVTQLTIQRAHTRLINTDVVLVATLTGDRKFVSGFADRVVCNQFANLRRFPNAIINKEV